MTTTTGTVYLLHFDRPYRHAGHYTGWTTNLPARLTEHAAGHGARLLAVAKSAGIGWRLARTWPGTRHLERALKRQGGASRRCPLCGVHPRIPGGFPMSICFCASGCALNSLADPSVFGTDCSCWCHTRTEGDLRLCANWGTELGRLEPGTRCTDCAALLRRRSRGGAR